MCKVVGITTRFFITVFFRDPVMMRSLKIELFWDNCDKPGVSAPFGDFFCSTLGRNRAFVSELFSKPESRSYDCFIPMPFRKAARMTVTNESDRDIP